MLNIYFVVTGVCLLFDFIVLMFIVKHFGAEGEEDSEMMLLIFVLSFFGVIFAWISNAVTMRFILPENIGKVVFDTILGLGKALADQGGQAASNMSNRAQEKMSNSM